jgi:NADH:ubiquinone oxidoreductase subunit E
VIQIHICVGSSCHLKGSYHIIKGFERLIKKNKLEDKVEIVASFCLGNCTNGVSAKVGNEAIKDLNTSNIEKIFREYVLERV